MKVCQLLPWNVVVLNASYFERMTCGTVFETVSGRSMSTLFADVVLHPHLALGLNTDCSFRDRFLRL